MTYPAVPLPNQWTNAFVSETDMFNRIDVPLNAMGDAISLWGKGLPEFRAIGAVNPAALDANIGFNIIVADFVDSWNGTGSGWDAVNKRYVVQKDGLYAVQAGWSQASAVAGVLELLTFPAPRSGIIFSGQMGAAANFGQDIDTTDNFVAGAQIALRMRGALATAATVASQTLTYLSIMMIGY